MSRRRRPGGGGGSNGDLAESLLAVGEPRSSAPPPSRAAPQHQKQLIVYRPFSVEVFVRLVVQSWLAFLSSLSSCLRSLLGSGAVSLTLTQAERLEELQERLAVPYDRGNPAHQQQLRELWGLAFAGLACAPGLKTPQWKDMGWQGDDPGTDFRGAGLLGLDNLVYLGTHHPELFRRLRHKTQGVRSDWEYPFAVAGLNLTFALADVLGLATGPPGKPPATAAGRAFCALLGESDAAFEEVYAASFELLDRVWLARGASYMQFNEVLKEVRGHVDAALAARPRTLAQLQQRLLARG